MGCVPLVGFLGAQFGYSLHYVITKSLFGFFVGCGRFVLFCFVLKKYFVVITCQLHLLPEETMSAEGGLQGAKPTLTTDLSAKASSIHLAVVWNKD